MPSSSPKGKQSPHVAVCVDNSRAHGRRILQGIADYVDAFGPWSLFLDPQADSRYPEGRSKNWKGDGILTYIDNPSRAERLHNAGIPTVELFGFRQDKMLPAVINDDHGIGVLAAEHLIERHFKHFAFSGYADTLWSEQRYCGFTNTVRKAQAGTFACLNVQRPQTLPEWESVQEQLTEWIKGLPKPVGLMACSDHHAQRVLDACHRAAIAVPEEVAVIGVDNNEEICRLSNPPLSSVIDDAVRVGYEGAKLLDRLMRGETLPRGQQTQLIPPLGVATRRSTDITAIQDKLIAEVVRHIRERACEGLALNELPRQFGISRSVFYRRFEEAMQRSPHEEVLRVKLERARTLLIQTRLPLEKVAELSGFQSAAYFSVVFKRKTSQTPGEYRSRQSAMK